MFLKLNSISPSSNGVKIVFVFSPSPIQAANEKYLKPPNSGIHGESELFFFSLDILEPRYPPMPFCWIAQAESFKNIPGSVDLKHTRGLMLQKCGECLKMYETLLNNGFKNVGVLPKHWKTRRFREGFNFLVSFLKIRIDYLPHVVNHGFVGPPKLYWPNLLTGFCINLPEIFHPPRERKKHLHALHVEFQSTMQIMQPHLTSVDSRTGGCTPKTYARTLWAPKFSLFSLVKPLGVWILGEYKNP